MVEGPREILRKNYLFAALTDEELAALEQIVHSRDYAPGEHIVREGEAGSSLYLVAKGGVNVTKEPDGHFLSYLGAGGYFGEMALFLPNSARTASCVAAMATICLIIEKNELERFCNENAAPGNKIYREIIRALAERLAATSADLAMLMKSQVMDQTKVATLVAEKK